jgi:hypothetical protein
MVQGMKRKGAGGEEGCVKFATKKKRMDISVGLCGLSNNRDNISEPERLKDTG